MKKYLSLLVMLVTVLLFSPDSTKASSFYEDFGPFYDVKVDKVWTIGFNKEEQLLENASIWVEDSSKNIVPTTLQATGKFVKVHPQQDYAPNTRYTLYIAQKSSIVLQKQQRVTFSTENVQTSSPGVDTRIQEIQQQYNVLKPRFVGDMFVTVPSVVSPYSLGKLKNEVLQDALNTTNLMRFIAHLPSDITLNETFNTEAQAAAVVNAANNKITHYPTKPQNMTENMFTEGSNGAKSSNLGMGYRSIVQSIVDGYMEDGDNSNIDRVGHRVWVLSPKLKQVGFGFANTKDARATGHTAMKVIDSNMYRNSSSEYDFISWPAHTAMPTKYFTSEFPWSVSLNADKYDSTKISKVQVQLERLTDNKTWNFAYGKSDGYFNISTGNYGYLPYTIIFRPTEKPSYQTSDRYRVTISNLIKKDGQAATVEFETTFFALTE